MTKTHPLWTLARVLLASAAAVGVGSITGCTTDAGPLVGSPPSSNGMKGEVDNGQTGSPGERDTCAAEIWRGPDSATGMANCTALSLQAKEGVWTFYCSCDLSACDLDPETGAPRQTCATTVSVEEDNSKPCPRALQKGCNVAPGWSGFCKGAGVGEESLCWPRADGAHTCRCPGFDGDVQTNERDCQKASAVCVMTDAGTAIDSGVAQDAGSSQAQAGGGAPGERDTCLGEVWRGPNASTRSASCGVVTPDAKNGTFTFYCSCDLEVCDIEPSTGVPRESCAKAVAIRQDNTKPCPRALHEACGVQPGWTGFCRGAGVDEESVCWPDDAGLYTCRCPGNDAGTATGERDCQKASAVCVPDAGA